MSGLTSYVSSKAPLVSFTLFVLLLGSVLFGLSFAFVLLLAVAGVVHFVVCFAGVKLYPLRFAAFVGLVCVVGAVVFVGLGLPVVGGLFAFCGVVAAFLRLFFNFCLGCWVFNHTPLVRWFAR